MKKAIVTVAAALAGLTAAQAAPTVWTTGSGGNGHSYEFISGQFTWEQARAAALGAGGYLVIVTSAAENDFLVSLSAQLGWIGLTDAGQVVNDFHWVDGPEAGQTPVYTNWAGGEPNNCCGGEDYVHMNWGGGGTWNDHGGPGNPGQLNGYFVEFAAASQIPLPATLPLIGLGLLAMVGVRRVKKAP
jgi:hypothetical protein